MTRKHRLNAPVGKKFGGREMELNNKVSAEYTLNRKMVKQIMMHHNYRIPAVFFCKLCLLFYPFKFFCGHTVLG